jgi:hypothetical protein
VLRPACRLDRTAPIGGIHPRHPGNPDNSWQKDPISPFKSLHIECFQCRPRKLPTQGCG